MKRHFNSSTVVFQANASIAVISTHCRESCLFINSKKSRVKNNFSSKVFLVKLNQIQRELLEESLIPGQLPPLEPFDLTINVDHLESVEMSGQRQSFIFSISEKSWTTLVFRPNNKMASSQNPVKINFSSLLLLRPKIVKISLVDGLLGCS